MKPIFRWLAIAIAAALATSCGTSDEATDGETETTISPGQEQIESGPGTTTSSAKNPEPETAVPETAVPETGAAPEPTETTEPLPDWPDVALGFQEIGQANQPIDLAARNGTSDLFLAEKSGRIKIVSVTAGGNDAEQFEISGPVLDLSGDVSGGSEQGLLGLAFSPDGERLYVNYTDRSGNTAVDEFTMDADLPDSSTRRRVLSIDQPFSNHNGGGLRFGPDGYLYVGMGDGGRAGDPLNSGQDSATLLGSMLRIDPSDTSNGPYAVPSTNPFVGSSGDQAEEAWLIGMRNPWRYSFDRITGDFWIGDVGQNAFEEIHFLPSESGAGANMGWNLFEGFERFAGGEVPSDYVPPVHAYAHQSRRCSVTGGFVYRGAELPALNGIYIFGDFCSGEIFGLDHADSDRVERLSIAVQRSRLVSFGEDNSGELFVLDVGGRVLKVVAG